MEIKWVGCQSPWTLHVRVLNEASVLDEGAAKPLQLLSSHVEVHVQHCFIFIFFSKNLSMGACISKSQFFNTMLLLLLSHLLCPTLCDPIDGSSPGSAVPGILQARTLEC